MVEQEQAFSGQFQGRQSEFTGGVDGFERENGVCGESASELVGTSKQRRVRFETGVAIEDLDALECGVVIALLELFEAVAKHVIGVVLNCQPADGGDCNDDRGCDQQSRLRACHLGSPIALTQTSMGGFESEWVLLPTAMSMSPSPSRSPRARVGWLQR